MEILLDYIDDIDVLHFSVAQSESQSVIYISRFIGEDIVADTIFRSIGGDGRKRV